MGFCLILPMLFILFIILDTLAKKIFTHIDNESIVEDFFINLVWGITLSCGLSISCFFCLFILLYERYSFQHGFLRFIGLIIFYFLQCFIAWKGMRFLRLLPELVDLGTVGLIFCLLFLDFIVVVVIGSLLAGSS